MALRLARKSSHTFTPDANLEQQLRIYEQCNYNMYDYASSQQPSLSKDHNIDPDSLQSCILKPSNRTLKPAYTVWKASLQIQSNNSQDAEKDGATTMANMAAAFARRRLAAQKKSTQPKMDANATDPEPDLEDEGTANADDFYRQSEQWKRVKEMEKAWNERLIRGDVERAKEQGRISELMADVFDSVGERSWRSFVNE